MNRLIFLSVILIFIIACSGYASLEKITLFVWCELEPLTGETAEGTLLTREEAARRILEETRVLVSAMIYGFEFTYTPSDTKRNVKEEFELKPIREISWGDKGLLIAQSEVKDKILYATVTYTLDDFQVARMAAWESASIPTNAGRGEGSIYTGYKERLTSFRNSVKEAVRSYMRQRIFNKPREIRGEVLLAKTPSVGIIAGKYLTTSSERINIREVIPYVVY